MTSRNSLVGREAVATYGPHNRKANCRIEEIAGNWVKVTILDGPHAGKQMSLLSDEVVLKKKWRNK